MTTIKRWTGGCVECAGIVLAAVALVSALWYFTVERVSYEREDSVDSAVRSNGNLALALEEQSVRALKAAEQILLFIKHEYQEEGQLISLAKLHKDGLAETSIFAAAFIVDERGEMLLADRAGASPSFADRDFFVHHRNTASDETHIGKPIQGRVTGRAVIPVTLRLSKADGSFGGVYVVGVDAEYFIRSFQRFDVGRKGVIQLVRSDGVALARRIGDHLAFGESRTESSLMRAVAAAPVGSFVTLGRQDGSARFQSYRKVEGYPLLVAVGTSVDETLAEFTARKQVYYLAAGGASLMLAAFAAALLVATRRRQRAMRELAASEELHRATFDKAAVGITHATLDGTLLRVNAKFCELMGYTEGELVGRSFLEFTHPDDRPRAAPLMRALLDSVDDGALQAEKRSLRKDGRAIWVLLSTSVVRDAGGRPAHFVTMVQDITERKTTEAQLLEQLDELRRFQKVTVDRELRMLDLEAQLRALREKAVA